MERNMIEVRFMKTRGIIARLIRWFTWSEFNHVDINVNGKWYGASRTFGVHRSDKQRPSYIYAEKLFISSTPEEREYVLRFLEGELGKSYDWRGIFGFILRKNLHHRDKWFCSEYVGTALNYVEGRYFEDTFKLSPNSLYDFLSHDKY